MSGSLNSQFRSSSTVRRRYLAKGKRNLCAKMFRFVIIANQVGLVHFSHYFEAVPDSLRIKLEKEAVEKCLNSGEREV